MGVDLDEERIGVAPGFCYLLPALTHADHLLVHPESAVDEA